MNGSLYTWSSINSYFASYLFYKGNDVTAEDTAFLMPCIFLIQYCFMTIGVKIGNKFGPRISSLIGILLMLGSYAIMLCFNKYIFILLAMGIFGMGDGIANLSVIKNCWKYFPKNTGLVNGIIIGGLGLSSSVLTPIADYLIINPNEEKTDDRGYYPEKVALNLWFYLKFLTILFIVLGVIGISLTIAYEKEPVIEETEADTGNSNLVSPDRTESSFSVQNQSNLCLLCDGFFSWKNLMMISFCFCGLCKYFI